MIAAMIWLGAALLVVVMFYSIIHEQRRRARMTEAEYEERARQGASLLSVGVLALDQVLRPDLERAKAVQEDVKRGQVPNAHTGQGESAGHRWFPGRA